MAIVRMRKLDMVAMSYEKDTVLNALQRTGAVEVALHKDTALANVPKVDFEALKTYAMSVNTALSTLVLAVDNYEKEKGMKSTAVKDGFDVSYSEFISINDKKAEIDQTIETIRLLTEKKNQTKAELVKANKEKESAGVYSALSLPFTAFLDTAHTRARLGVVLATVADSVCKALEQIELCGVEVLHETNEEKLLFITAHKSVASETDGVLASFGFTDCPYRGTQTGKEIYQACEERETAFENTLKELEEQTYTLKDEIRLLKIYSDYLDFLLEKQETSEKLRETAHTFLLQAYLPVDAEEQVKEEIIKSCQTVYFEFSDPTEEDNPPTLLKNNRLVENFEGITNTYSAPHYREFDPNAVMSFFYSLFMGFIIGDAGYGLIMLLAGGWLWWKGRNRPTGLSHLAGAFAFGGVFAIIWGLLFNSLFGFVVLPKTVMPNPQTDQCSLAGISVPSVLIIAMLLGVVQIFAGYMCKAVQLWKRGDIFGGICEGVFWALFSVGVGLAIVGFVEEMHLPKLAIIGAIMAGVCLVLAMLTAGRNEKFFGKFTKGFGAAYGVINYASDILSYARLYGLMLSGAVIAQIIATYSLQFILSGNIGLILLAVVLLLIGNAFNLVMNLLGAYIHDARLQYVEFYGRFFEGEGELFSPLGSKHKYVYLLPAGENK